jgi:hypothetical protein
LGRKGPKGNCSEVIFHLTSGVRADGSSISLEAFSALSVEEKLAKKDDEMGPTFCKISTSLSTNISSFHLTSSPCLAMASSSSSWCGEYGKTSLSVLITRNQ